MVAKIAKRNFMGGGSREIFHCEISTTSIKRMENSQLTIKPNQLSIDVKRLKEVVNWATT